MAVQKVFYALFGNGRRDNHIFTLNAGQTMKLHFKESGIDDSDNRYYDLRSAAKKVHIIVNQVATITKIQNKELKDPMTLGTDTPNVFREGIEWGTIVVESDVASTTFEVYAS